MVLRRQSACATAIAPIIIGAHAVARRGGRQVSFSKPGIMEAMDGLCNIELTHLAVQLQGGELSGCCPILN